ncbi:MAG TPA: T9SS type A sorting domain-containing protein [Chitinophagales bacterium]|nr:T9SS type A sorting domain-containing protein [Chitinophagales bacterium]
MNFNRSSGIGLGGANDYVWSIVVQADGKILIGGAFTSVNGSAVNAGTGINRIARLNPDGSLDAAFNSIGGIGLGGADNDVRSIAVQPDGKILIGGAFTSINGSAESTGTGINGIARLNPDGSLDPAFNSSGGVGLGGANGQVSSIVVQPDGKMLIGGDFTSVNGSAESAGTGINRITRLNADGSIDATFNSSGGVGLGGATGGFVTCMSLLGDGKILLGGAFTAVNGTPRDYFAVLSNQIATDPTQVVTCSGYYWAVNGQTYTQSGIYTHVTGCLTEILDLTILPATSNTTQVVICLGYYWAVNGQTYTQSGIYTHVTSCHTEILDLTITPNTTLLASVSGTVTNVCEGQTLSLTATGGTNYQWSGPNGFSASTATITRPNADVSMSGLYTVTVSAGIGCSSVITVTTTVHTNPSGTISGATSYCTGQTINLSASGGTTYQWGGPGGFSSGTATISRPNTTAAMAGVYSVTITNTYGCTTTQSVDVSVGAAPAVTISGNTTACTGGIIALTASPAGAANYQWSGPGFTQNGTNATMTRSATTGTGGTYSVTVTDTNGCTGAASVLVTLTTSTVSATISGTTTYCAGSTISLTATGGTGYQWTTPDAQTLSGATISRPNATTAMGGVYVVTVTNASGCAATTSRTVTVHALPNAVISGNTSYCVGGILSLTASGGTGYQWAGPGFTSTSASISRTNLTTAMAGTYTVTVTGTGNCKSTASVVVTVNAKPVVSINGSTAATGSLSVCAGTDISLTASGGVSYQWSGPGGFTSSDATMTRPAVSGLVANGGTGGTYTVTVTNAAGCTSTASRSVTILAAPVVNITLNQTNTCAPTAFSLTATGGGTYLWNGPNGFAASTASFTRNPSNTTMSGAYNVTVTATNGCKTTASRTVTVAACKDAAEDIPATTLTAYPNPSDGHTTVSFTSHTTQHIKLSVFAVDGKEVAVLFNEEAAKQTAYAIELDLHTLPAGTYHAVLQQADGSSTQVRLVIVR